MPGQPTYHEERRQLATVLKQLGASGLSHGSSGNASIRVRGGMLISPTGFACEDIEPEQLVFVDGNGSCASEQLRPSSEWHFHHSIYQTRDDAGAIVHCHSRYATAIACTRRSIPSYHYMVAVAGGKDIRCADYATFGTQQLADAIASALQGRKACLLANHGQVAVGADPAEALALAEQVEDLAAGYYHSLALGGPSLLSDSEMDVVLEKFQTYGKQDSSA